MRRHWCVLVLVIMVCAGIVGAGLSNSVGSVLAGTEPFRAFIGYGQLLIVSEGLEDGGSYEGFADVAGYTVLPDVVVLVSKDGVSTRSVRMDVAEDGSFRGRVWFLDGPGGYKLSVACRSAAATKYTIVCEAEVVNTAIDAPLVPIEYEGYGEDLIVYSPRGGSSKVVGALTITGWSGYPTVRAVVESVDEGHVLEYTAAAAADGSFAIKVPLQPWLGRCEVKLCSRKVGPRTWRGAAVYRVEAAEGAIHAVQPSYQGGLILATGEFEVSGRCRYSAPMLVEILDERRRPVGRPMIVPVHDGSWWAKVTPPGGMSHFIVRVTSSDPASAGEELEYRVALVSFGTSVERAASTRGIAERSAIQEVAQEIERAVDGGHARTYRLVKAVHDWVASRIRYDVLGAITGRTGPGDALTTLSRGQGVCLGYANLTSAILDCLRIPNRVVIGNADNGRTVVRHAWNEVEIEGRVVFMDVTWDAGTVEGFRFVPKLKWSYFDPDPELVAFTHFPDDLGQ